MADRRNSRDGFVNVVRDEGEHGYNVIGRCLPAVGMTTYNNGYKISAVQDKYGTCLITGNSAIEGASGVSVRTSTLVIPSSVAIKYASWPNIVSGMQYKSVSAVPSGVDGFYRVR